MTPATAIQRAEQWRKEGACGEAAKVAIALLNELQALQASRAIPEGHVVVPGWLPIESAPKDKWILAYRPQRLNGQSSSLVWVIWDESIGIWAWPTDSTFDIYTDDFFERDSRGHLIWEDSYQDDSFTHWMPLPAAPANKEG